MEDFKSERPKKKIGHRNYVKTLVLACLVILAIFLAPWLWMIIILWIVWMLVRKFKR